MLPALLLTATAAAASTPLPTISLELAHLSEDGYQRIDGLSLEKSVLVRLVQEGFAVLARAANPDVLVDLTDTPEGVRIAATRSGARIERAVPFAGAPLEELQLELAQKIVDAVRSLPAPPPVVVRVVEQKPDAAPPPAATPTPAPITPVSWAFGAFVGPSFVLRSGGNDAAPDVRLVARTPDGFEFGVGALRLSSDGGGVTVRETIPEVGIGVTGPISDHLTWSAGLRAGILWHRWDDIPPASGSAIDAVGALPLELRLRIGSGLVLGLRGVGRVATMAREHVVDGAAVWTRGAFAAEAGVFVGWLAP